MFQILLVISSFVSLSYSVSDCNGHESKYFVTCYTVPDVPLNHIIRLISANGSVRIYTIPFCKNGSAWNGHQSWVDVFSIHLKLVEIAKNAPHSLCTIFSRQALWSDGSNRFRWLHRPSGCGCGAGAVRASPVPTCNEIMLFSSFNSINWIHNHLTISFCKICDVFRKETGLLSILRVKLVTRKEKRRVLRKVSLLSGKRQRREQLWATITTRSTSPRPVRLWTSSRCRLLPTRVYLLHLKPHSRYVRPKN